MPSSNLSLAPSLKCKTAGKFDLNGINSALGAGYLDRKLRNKNFARQISYKANLVLLRAILRGAALDADFILGEK